MIQPAPVSPNAIRFGLFEADLSAGELRKRGRKIPLQDQPFRVLTLLLRRPGELVSREEFQRALWPGDTFVEFDEGLNKAIQKLRQALDDSADNPRFIETLPRKGYRFIAPVDRTAAEASGTQTQPTPAAGIAACPPVAAPVKRRRTEVLPWVLFGVVSVALVVLVGVYFWAFRPASQPTLKTVPLTSYPGRQINPAFSPDGKQVAFAWDGEQGGNFDIYVKLVDAGAPLRLTSSPANEYAPAWSPDARYIAFCRDKSTGTAAYNSSLSLQLFGVSSDRIEIWMIPALGGAERRLGESAGCGLSWSPDGKYLALMDKNAPREPYSIFLLSVETGDKRKLTSPPAEYSGDLSPRFSPDGKTIAFDRSGPNDGIYVLPVASGGEPLGDPRRLILAERQIFGLDWTADGRRIVYSSGLEDSANLWITPASEGKHEPLAIAGQNVVRPSVDRVGNRLVYERRVWDLNIWRIPGPNSSERKSAPSRLIASTQVDAEPQFSPDGTKIAFNSSRSGNYEIWICDREGRNPVQLTSFNGPALGSLRWSADSRWIAFDSSKAGNLDIYVISADGGPARRLTSGPSNNVRPSWSRDGQWIYFGSNRSGVSQIWKEPTAGGMAVQITQSGGEEAFESTDGKFVYWAKPGATGIWRVPLEGGEESQVLDVSAESLWMLADQGIYFFDLKNPTEPTLKFYSFAAGKTRLLRQFPKDTRIDTLSTTLSVSPDGHWILHTQFDQAGSNLMLVENF